MDPRFLVSGVAAAFLTAFAPGSARAFQARPAATPHEDRIPVGKASLYVRDIGQGPPIIVLHGGPDFDIAYLLPEFDRLADSFHLIYYDQRGRGKSAAGVEPQDVSLASEVEDLELVRRHFQADPAVVLGHSWGAVLALEYALRHPDHIAGLILMNPAPVSASDVTVLREAQRRALGADMDRQREIIAGAPYQQGDPEAVTARYRIHFERALVRPEDLEKLMARMKAGFISQGKAGIVKARAVEDRLMADTWAMNGYDLLPRLRALSIPTLVIYGDHDFIPVTIAQHITDAIPGAHLVTLKDCGHFAYLECGDAARRAIDGFFQTPMPRPQ